ncbi:MAG: hypothetical protein QOI04_1091 [Verrucomicrobiota bacterium]|jgi:dinuclear metal center YbgI/SA1388 family protein
MPSTNELVAYCNDYLRVSEIEDWPNALNGLQIDNSGTVKKIGAAVDVSTRALQAAAERGIDFLIVHHGLFWPGLQTVTGALYRQLKMAFEHDIALYSAHLPLDLHSEVGNNAQLAASLGFNTTEPFLEAKGQPIGVRVYVDLAREELTSRLEKSLGATVKTFPFGPSRTNAVAIVSGGAGSEIARVADAKIDTFITGEADHWVTVAAREFGMNLFLGGHYATETFGVKALAAHLSERFKLPWEFLDLPPDS